MEPKVSRARLQIGDWLVDPSLDEVHRGETRIKLEPRKMQLLVALAQRPGELVTTEELLETVWAGAVVTQSSLYQSIAQLRRTLGDETESPTFIATIPRKGYRLIAPVARVDETHGPTDRATTPAPQSNREPPAAATKGRIERARLDRRWLTGAAAAGLTVALGAASGWWADAAPPGSFTAGDRRSPLRRHLPGRSGAAGRRWPGERGDRRTLGEPASPRLGSVVGLSVPPHLSAPSGGRAAAGGHPRSGWGALPDSGTGEAHRAAPGGGRR